ncbi:MAG TPA: carboxypeptidase-like regulatory domain-containing protein [Pyrinomonadaceae bacterium]|jgi:hypothetical protein
MIKGRILSSIFALLLLCVAAFSQHGDSAFVVEVRDASGQPVGYACVTLIPKEGEIVFRKADRKGQVRLNHIAAGRYRVVVKAAGYEAQKREVAFDGQAEAVAFTMQPRGTAN